MLMLTAVSPKLPMRNKQATRSFYIDELGFQSFGSADYEGYLMVQRDEVQLHFFEFATLDPKENYGQVYIRTTAIHPLYEELRLRNIRCSPLERKPWNQWEFATWDPDNNLITFGESV